MGAGQAVDHLPRPPLRKKNASEASDRLMSVARADPEWAVGFEDECWWSSRRLEATRTLELARDTRGRGQVRKPAIARFHDVRPRAVVLCKTLEEVSETISFARRSGLRMATRSGGHCFAGRSSTEGIA
jgi:hypothetical protein